MSSLRIASAAGALLAVTLAACGTASTPSGLAASGAAASSATASGATTSSATATGSATATLRAAQTSLGEVVVDAKGMTLYVFTKDKPGSGTSACTGQCLALWPPLVVSGTPTEEGVSGDLGTITTPDGKKQATLRGWPLYYYAKDTAAGDVKGHGVGGVWFVVGRDGMPMLPAKTGAGY